MPRHAHHEPALPACCSCCDGGCAPAPCYYPAPVPAPCYYPAPVPVAAPAPPSSSASDQLLQAIAAHLLLGSSASAPAPAPPPQPQQQQQQQQPPAAHNATNPYPYPHQYQYQHQQQEAKAHSYAHLPPPQQQQHSHQLQPNASEHGHLLLHSLLRRVAALESALPRCFPPPSPARRAPHPNPRPRRSARQELVKDEEEDEEEAESSPPSPPPHRRSARRPMRREPSFPAWELAARTIQAHFRRFLARRSRTLRQLKELAVLRSKAAALRGSLSGRRNRADPAAVSEAAMGLLLRLDAIQGGDPMIREGKRAVSRELSRILEFVDKVLVKEQEQLAMGHALDSDDYHEGCSAEFMLNRPVGSKKKVSFSSNGRIHELNEETDNAKVVDEDSESSGSGESDGVEVVPAKRNANGKPGLAAPTPVHMDSRRIPAERR